MRVALLLLGLLTIACDQIHAYQSTPFDASADSAAPSPDRGSVDLSGDAARCSRIDTTGDGNFDLMDLAQLRKCFTDKSGDPACVPADLNGDKKVDLSDIVAFQKELAACYPRFSAPCKGGIGDLPAIDVVYSATMAACISPGKTHAANQCAAEASFCNVSGGWRMCNASDFLARGGDGRAMGAVGAWLRSCVRNGGAGLAPTDQLCDQCANAKALPVVTDWLCAGGSPVKGISYAYLAVMSGPQCREIGSTKERKRAYWNSQSPAATGYGAVCCK